MRLRLLITASIILISLSAYTQTQPKVDTANYVLVGKLNDFKLLFASVTTPDDVTPNQKKAVAEWINKGLQVLNQPADTTKKEKPKTTK